MFVAQAGVESVGFIVSFKDMDFDALLLDAKLVLEILRKLYIYKVCVAWCEWCKTLSSYCSLIQLTHKEKRLYIYCEDMERCRTGLNTL